MFEHFYVHIYLILKGDISIYRILIDKIACSKNVSYWVGHLNMFIIIDLENKKGYFMFNANMRMHSIF